VRYALSLLMPAAAILFTVGCDDEGPDLDVESSIPVRYDSVRVGSIQEYALATGTVHAVSHVSFTSEQGGYYRLEMNPRTGRPFSMGDEVDSAEIIISLENPEYVNQTAYDSKRLNFEISEREYNKQKSIYEKGGITLRELTDAERAYIDARYSLENARIQLAKLKIAPTFNGTITALPFHSNGQYIEPGTMLAEVMDYRSLYTEVTLPSNELGRVAQGQDVRVTAYSGDTDTLWGEVTQASPALNPDSRMFDVTVRIDNDSLLFRPGMFVKVEIVVKHHDSVVVIPKDVILDSRRGKTVFVIDGGLAIERTLEIGLSNRDEVEVLSGLKPNERLIVEGFETLRDRSKVKATN